ncbi:uncharacterized protein B0H18DRAFT_1125267 [Fomitopsis serialis]|uniref:uncharacterized protein n=1 Tax=Fomitopsis serialis TaxID=139415 RepID=UPI002007BC96|nr:uncharacterized protein B0H18DRAFT_1125267 [Neoantrodia serialis]KAH9914831.1 hypothetical protein B0H18DRAFT_1125267 [Neoantrodia serialis]
MSSDSSAAAVISAEAALVKQTYALIFVATFIGQILFGIVIAQVYIYFTRYQRDALWVKIFVLFLFICDVCSAIFTICWMFYLFISNWGDITVFSQPTWMLATDPLVLGLMTCATHFFFARRIKIITGSSWLAGLICFFGVGTLGGTIEFLRVKSLTDLTSLKPIAIVWLLSAAVGDVMITVILSWSLKRKKSGFRRTDQIVDRVIRVTIQNGFLTAAVATAALTLYLASSIPYHLALSLVLPRMYSNTILSSLNHRDVQHPDSSTDRSASGIGGFATGSTSRRGQQTEVVVHVEAHELSDATNPKSDSGDWDVPSKTHPV